MRILFGIFIGPLKNQECDFTERHWRTLNQAWIDIYHPWNLANDPFNEFRRGIRELRNPLVFELLGLTLEDMPEYERLMGVAFDVGYTIQRHPVEQHGIVAGTPMLVRQPRKVRNA